MYNILIVDDEKDILDGLCIVIDWVEYGIEEVLIAESGKEAIKILETEKVEILLTDVCMDGMNGIELIDIVKKRFPEVKCMIQSGYDDFKYVKQAMKLGIENYFLKPINEDELIGSIDHIQSVIEKQRLAKIKRKNEEEIIKENTLLRWINDTISTKELELKAKTLDLDLDSECYYVGNITSANYRYEKSKNVKEFSAKDKKIMNNIIIRCKNMLGKNAYTFLDLDFNIIIIFHGKKKEYNNNKAKLKEVIRIMHKTQGIDFFVAIGKTFESFIDVSKSYKTAMHLIHINTRKDANTLLEWKEKKMERNDLENKVFIRFEDISQAIKSLKKDKIEKVLDRISEEIIKSNIIGTYWEKIVLQHLTMTIISCISFQDNPELYENIERLIMQIQYGKNKGFSSTMEAIKQLSNDIIDYLKNKKKDYTPVICEMLNLVESNYTKDLNLSEIAEKYKVNPVYLGQLFKNEVGKYFSTYLNQIRIKKAKEMLKESDLSVTDIGSKVGYSSKAYFFSVFKKTTNMTPSEYRRNESFN